ncbi:MAG TPA: TadE/TadG family type IV pilus assembly protein [Xanthobacteraceae bacterium]|nr:TadE/TadG family type IV pilus assembly protein [Xanthobacteraceae bacterium]
MHFGPRRLGAWTRRTLARPLRRFVRHRGGAVAIEFPLILVPFLAFLYAIMETALVFFASQVLETGAQEAARLVLTGQAQGGGFNQSTFKTAVCARMTGWLDCANKMSVDVRTFTSFSSVEMTSPLNANGTLASGGYNPGGPGDIVVVRLSYEFPIAIKLWNPNLANMAGNNRLIIATAAFRNEPYN